MSDKGYPHATQEKKFGWQWREEAKAIVDVPAPVAVVPAPAPEPVVVDPVAVEPETPDLPLRSLQGFRDQKKMESK
jgi:hypothetical protein